MSPAVTFAMFVVPRGAHLSPVGFSISATEQDRRWRNAWEGLLFHPAALVRRGSSASPRPWQGVPFHSTRLRQITRAALSGPAPALRCSAPNQHRQLVMHGGRWIVIKTDGAVASRGARRAAMIAAGRAHHP